MSDRPTQKTSARAATARVYSDLAAGAPAGPAPDLAQTPAPKAPGRTGLPGPVRPHRAALGEVLRGIAAGR